MKKLILLAGLLLIALPVMAVTINVPGDYGTIQAAINVAVSGDDIIVAAGTYTEQLSVDGKVITLTGAGQGVTTIISPAVLAISYTIGTDNYHAIIGVINGAGLTISDLTIDGAERSWSHTFLLAIGLLDSDGSVTDCEIKGINQVPYMNGYSYGVYGRTEAAVNRTLSVTDCSVTDHLSTAIYARGAYMTATIADNTVTGYGPTDEPVQYGIRVFTGAVGTVTGNIVMGHTFTGETYGAAGILVHQPGAPPLISNNTISESQFGVWCYDAHADIEYNDISATPVGVGGENFELIAGWTFDGGRMGKDDPRPIPQEPEAPSGYKGSRSTHTYNIIGNTLNGGGGIWSWGIGISTSGEDAIVLLATGNEIANCNHAVGFNEGVAGMITSATINGNSIYGSISEGILNNATLVVDAEGNWWGDTNGPTHASNPNGTSGDEVTDNVKYSPWVASSGSDTDPGTPGWQLDLSEVGVCTNGTITEGIDLVNGSTVYVATGTYNETLVIDKAVALIGASGTVLDGTGLGLVTGVGIKSGDVSFDNIDVLNFGGNGIIVGYESGGPGDLQNVVIRNCTVAHIQPGLSHGFGIYVGYESEGFGYDPPHLTDFLDYSGLVIENNEIYDTAEAAIVLQSITASTGVLQVRNNHLHDAGNSGLWIDCAREILAEGNLVQSCRNGIYFSALADGWYVPDTPHGPMNVEIRDNVIADQITDNWYTGNGVVLFAGWPANITVSGCSITGNQMLGVNNYLGADVSASGNWWGDLDPTDDLSANVDYTPWLAVGTDTSGDPGFQGDLSVLHVDDDSPQVGSGPRIQEGIDMVSGSTVNVAAGTYAGTISANKPVTLLGANAGIHPAVGTHPTEVVGTRSAESILSNNYPALIPSADNVTVDGFMFTGSGGRIVDTYADANNFHLTNCIFDNNVNATTQGVIQFGGGSHVDMTLDFNLFQDEGDHTFYTGGGPYDRLKISWNVFRVMGDGLFWTATPLVDGVIQGNEIDGTIGGVPGIGWGTFNAGQLGNVQIKDNWGHDLRYSPFQVGIIGGSITNNRVERIYPYPGYYGYCFQLYGGIWGTAVSTDVIVEDNYFSFNDVPGVTLPIHGFDITGPDSGPGVDGTTIVFRNNLFLDGGVIAGPLALRHRGDSTKFVDAIDNWWGAASGPYHATNNPAGTGADVGDYINFNPWLGGNVFFTPDPQTISLADPGAADGVVCEYFGGGSGLLYGYSIDVTWDSGVITAAIPGDFTKPDNGPFASAALFQVTTITGGVRIDAALGGAVPGIVSGELFKATYTAVGTPDYAISALTFATDTGGADHFRFRDGDNQPLTGFVGDDGQYIVDLIGPSVTAVGIVNNTLAHTDDFVKNTDAVTVTATISDGGGMLISDIFADLTGFGGGAAVNPGDYTAGVATWTLAGVTCTPADGTITVVVTADDGAGNSSSGSDGITSDNTAPTAVAGFACAPAHDEIDCVWTDAGGNDTNYLRTEIMEAPWGDYPDYATSAPAYPGVGTAKWSGTGAAVTLTYDVNGLDRDIMYLQAYAVDIVLLYSPADAGAQGRATNYWLGDVSDVSNGYGFYDGLVTAGQDVTALGSTYGLPDGHASFKDECDVGPTDNWSATGIPLPDDLVDFEDLMIFSMNYGVVAPLPIFQQDATEQPQMVWRMIEEGLWVLELTEPCLDLKGINLRCEMSAGSVLNIQPGSLCSAQAGTVFLQNIDTGGLDAGLSLLGTEMIFIGYGELLRVTFADGVSPVGIEVLARSSDNQPLVPEMETTGAPDAMPTVYRMAQNYPNPFNPKTMINFDLPAVQDVKLAVFGPDGRKIVTLVNETMPAGFHSVAWNGRDASGVRVASGVYFYRIEAGPLRQTSKMLMLK